MRAILCPHEIGRNTRQDNAATEKEKAGREARARAAREKRVRKKMIG
ncbi:hypothetical protein ALC56_02755 [Trachymyrmex septentrionalis]|uniref:Uncharacterized protein n=1 Tax=Trachymyrmex septentrionalis TaxID=34720 RepID=A0A195FR94_9HYME|nr:hypothetical protein ALC56_02755 [Trachymyrmex septentrionalis]